MQNKKSGGFSLAGALRLNNARLKTLSRDRRGVVLLAVMIFVAGLLPLITLVLTSINTESVSTAVAIKGAKADLASEKALNDAISLVVQEKSFPAFWTSVAQPNTAIIVNDPITGVRRNLVPDSGVIGAAGLDDILGTDDDHWIGPRGDGSYIGPADTADSSKMYRYSFTFDSKHGPTYIGQSWSYGPEYLEFAQGAFGSGLDIPFFNQFASVAPDGISGVADNINDGYDPDDPFNVGGGDTEAFLYGSGYYVGADEPRDPGGNVYRNLDPAGPQNIEQAMYNAKVNLYESIFTDLDRGPIPSTLLKSYANVTDEAGRINLNIFCKKVPLTMPESADTDYDFDGYGTNDFNNNEVTDELGMKWMDNPLFPDRDSTRKLDFDYGDGTFTAAGIIDWGRYDAQQGSTEPFLDTLDGVSMPELGETVQHYYEGDTDGDGVPESVESMYKSLRMLMSIPGVDPQLAANILTYLNPPHDANPGDGISRDAYPGGGNVFYRTLNSDYNSLPGDPGDTDPINGVYRSDACNVTPPLLALDLNVTGGVVDDFRWDFSLTTEDDMPLPRPAPLRTLEELLEIPGMTQRKFERMQDYITIFSYDTNVIATNIQDVGPNADLVNAYIEGDPLYNGALARTTPEELQDDDDVPDLRFDVDRFVFSQTVAGYRDAAEEMYAFVREHLPRTLQRKITLPAVDRHGRADSIESYAPNSDPVLYDLSNNGILLPHRDEWINGTGQSHPYNVGSGGHQEEFNGLPGGGYPALNPEFSLDSCLSIVMYRNGTMFEEDDYSFNPDNGAWSANANRAPSIFNSFAPWLFLLLGPFGDDVNWLLGPNNNPDPNAGYNTNPRVRPHGSGTAFLAGLYDQQDVYQNLLLPGSFDTPADMLNVPLYTFGNMSLSMMADPPSDYRVDVDNDGNVDVANLLESNEVNYYLSFSDVVDRQWYLENVHPDGPNMLPEGGFPNGDDNNQDVVLYEIRFTRGNRPGLVLPDQTVPNTGDYDCLLPITPRQLRLVGGGLNGNSTQLTVVGYDNVNNLNILGPDFTDTTAFSNTGGAGSLRQTFTWQQVPLKEDPVNFGSSGRPDAAGDWPTNLLPADNQAWAYDEFGDPYLTARAEVVRADGGNVLNYDTADRGAPIPDVRSDETSRVYLQYNDGDFTAPLRVDLLPVRTSADQFEIRSSVGGYSSDGGAYLLYDWGYSSGNDFPSGYDGTWPFSNQPGQAADPRVIQITPSEIDIVLRVYDLRQFIDPIYNNPNPVVPSADGYPTLTNPPYDGIWDDGSFFTFGTVVPPTGTAGSPATPGFPSDGYQLRNDPNNPGNNNFRTDYAEDRVTVDQIADVLLGVEAQISAITPRVYNDENARFRVSAAGGDGTPFNFRVRVYDPAFGDGGGGPWAGPDGISPMVLFPRNGLSTSRITAPGVPYNPLVVPLREEVETSYDMEEFVRIDAVGLPDGDYWVEVAAWDNNGAILTDPADDYAYTKLTVGGGSAPASDSVDPPELNASINLRPIDLADGARKGFVASASVDGGNNDYSYYWSVTRPQYSSAVGQEDVIIGEEVVDRTQPFLGIDAAGLPTGPLTDSIDMQSNNPAPTFEFHPYDFYNNRTGATGPDGIPDADGVYFVHLYVMSDASVPPNGASPSVAHDVAMVTIGDNERTPMAVLHAERPGNHNLSFGPNSAGQTGINPPQILVGGIDPPSAGGGDVIAIRGINFDNVNPTNNIVRFAGDVTAQAFAYENIGGDDVIYVIVPDSARTGDLHVSTSAGTSAASFFQTGFDVVFDLIGGFATNGAQLVFEVDFQGDGKIDYTHDTTGLPNQPEFIEGGTSGTIGLIHDYAEDGFGNYNATLVVTDRISGRKQTSHQLITIADLRTTAPENGMLANIWPNIDNRSETFTPAQDNGVSFSSAVDGTSTGVQRIWQVDDSNTRNRQTGDLVASGWADAADINGRVLVNSNGNFNSSVQVGDFISFEPGGAYGIIASIDSNNQVTIAAPTNPLLGVVDGNPVVRWGNVETSSLSQVIDTASEQNVPPLAGGAYDFIGNLYNPLEEYQGGLLNTDPIIQYRGGAYEADWAILTPGPAPTPANPHGLNTPSTGVLNVQWVSGGGGFLPTPKQSGICEGGPPPPATGGNIIKQTGGFPNAGDPYVGLVIWRFPGGLPSPLPSPLVPPADPANIGTITAKGPGQPTSHITTDINGWQVGDGYIILINNPAGWVAGDRWETTIPADQIRVGYRYEVYRSSDFRTTSRVDGSFATEDAELTFEVDMDFNYDLDPTLTNPTLVVVDWNGNLADDADNDGNGYPDNWDVYPVGRTSRFDGSVNGLETESVRFRHDFRRDGIVGSPYNEYNDPALSGRGEPTFATYYVTAFPQGRAPVNYGPYPLPVVKIGGDDYDLDLFELNVGTWDNSEWHKVMMQAQNRLDDQVSVDQMSIPPGLANYTDTMQTWVSYSDPVITANATSATLMRHQGVHGIGGALNWISDANADTSWVPNSATESPLSFNPVNHHEFQFPNGINQMVVPGGSTVKGLSFPAALPGVGRADIGRFVFYQADSGLYNGFGFITDNLPPGERTFSFDSQPIMLGDRSTGGGTPAVVSLEADYAANPQVGSSSQVFQLIPYVRGGAGIYTYDWTIIYEPGTMNTPVAVDPSGNDTSGYLSFVPQAAFSDELGAATAGTYRAFVRVTDGAGTVSTASRDFHVSTPEFQAFVMADPPSGSVGDEIQFHIYVEGGVAPYTVEIDYNEDDDGDGNKNGFAADESRTLNNGNTATFATVYSEPSEDWQEPDGGYEVRVRVVDDNGSVVVNSDPGDSDTIDTVVKIADVIPFHADMLVTPPSGVAPFSIDVHYSIAGGRRLANGGYNVTVQLVSTEGSVEGTETRTDSDTFGGDGPDDSRLPNYNDDPVQFVVPAPGNYFVQLIATDNGGQIATDIDDVFASGYLLPIDYGQPDPQVVRDRERRPMHAVRIWADPYLDSYSDGSGGLNTGNYENQQQITSAGANNQNVPYGGRLMEADLQVMGDLFTTDPNPSFRSFGMFAAKDPYEQDVYRANYADAGGFGGEAEDFYDTFTMGRVNLNTASEETLTALFMNIRTTRGYSYNVSIDVDGDTGTNENFRYIRNPAGDVFISESAARQLARAVVRYRTAYYDMYKPETSTDEEFGYRRADAAGGGHPDLGGNFRVDHLPVIGPWDGVNPHVYDIDLRNAPLADADEDVTNTWDHMAASYYDFGGTADMFYSPSDVAMVREPWEGTATVDLLGDGTITFTSQFTEPASNYAKYLNDVSTNGFYGNDRGNLWTTYWANTGLYPDSTGNYSRWAFDARNYFTYDGGQFVASIDLFDTGNSTFGFVPGTLGDAEDARNQVGIIESNDEVGYTYIPNPPFRNLFDLYKVINASQAPSPLPLEDNGGSYTLEVSGGLTPTAAGDYEVFSGPSMFRYVARWDDQTGEFIPIANYLDDIAPYVTCRSYVFRVEAIGAVTATGGSAGALVDTAKISRDRSRTAVVDTGPFWARRDVTFSASQQVNPLLKTRDSSLSYNIIWYKDESK